MRRINEEKKVDKIDKRICIIHIFVRDTLQTMFSAEYSHFNLRIWNVRVRKCVRCGSNVREKIVPERKIKFLLELRPKIVP